MHTYLEIKLEIHEGTKQVDVRKSSGGNRECKIQKTNGKAIEEGYEVNIIVFPMMD